MPLRLVETSTSQGVILYQPALVLLAAARARGTRTWGSARLSGRAPALPALPRHGSVAAAAPDPAGRCSGQCVTASY